MEETTLNFAEFAGGKKLKDKDKSSRRGHNKHGKEDSENDDSMMAEAEAIYPHTQVALVNFTSGVISASEFVGIYILFSGGIRKTRGRCFAGRLPNPITQDPTVDESFDVRSVEGLVEVLGGWDRLRAKMNRKDDAAISVMQIFNVLSFAGIKGNDNYINKIIVNWYLKLAPCKLLFSIPSPTQVLRMQAHRERVVTVFVTLEELKQTHTSQLNYMKGDINHSRKPLEFTLHDLKHMDHFSNPIIHLEQVGFFRCMFYFLGAQRKKTLKEFFLIFCGYDEECWQALEYVISDQNCYVPHLLSYMYSKMVQATERFVIAKDITLEADLDAKTRVMREKMEYNWNVLLDRFGLCEGVIMCEEGAGGEEEWAALTLRARRAAEALVLISFRLRDPLGAEEGEALRKWFQSIGRRSQDFFN